MARSVVVTGATGNVGDKLYRYLARVGGFELRLICLNPAGRDGVVTADIARYDDRWADVLRDADAVIHLAGNANPFASWQEIQGPNLDGTFNVFQAARRGGVRRVVLASSNWAMEGYKDGTERLAADLPPRPTTPYGAAKVVAERAGLSFAEQGDFSFVALRIGWCLRGQDARPPQDADPWEAKKWVSDRDLCTAFERAVLADDPDIAVLNLESDNVGMRWDLTETCRVLGWSPQDAG